MCNCGLLGGRFGLHCGQSGLLILVLAMTVVVLLRVSGVDLVTDPGAGPDGGSAGIGWGC